MSLVALVVLQSRGVALMIALEWWLECGVDVLTSRRGSLVGRAGLMGRDHLGVPEVTDVLA